MPLIFWLASGMFAVIAAVGSTWSPCGLSMISTITPLAEAGRARSYACTAGWFLLGALIGGAALGGTGAVVGALVDQVGLTVADRVAVGLVTVVVAMGFDADLVSPRLPHNRRRVKLVWLDQFRGWVFGLGSGIQIGFGLTTYIMSAALYLVVVFGALCASAEGALALGLVFGAGRGLAVLVGARVTSIERLDALLRRIEMQRGRARAAVVWVEAVGAAALAMSTTRPLLATSGVVAAAVVAWKISHSHRLIVLPRSNSEPASPPLAASSPLRNRGIDRSPLS